MEKHVVCFLLHVDSCAQKTMWGPPQAPVICWAPVLPGSPPPEGLSQPRQWQVIAVKINNSVFISIFSFHSPSRIHKLATRGLKNHLMHINKKERNSANFIVISSLKNTKKYCTPCRIAQWKLWSYYFLTTLSACLHHQNPESDFSAKIALLFWAAV